MAVRRPGARLAWIGQGFLILLALLVLLVLGRALIANPILFLQQVLNGLQLGFVYALIALGLTLVYGLLRILHVAHAAVFTLGAYVGCLLANHFGGLTIAIPGAMIISGLVGMALFRLCYQPILAQPPFVALIASIAAY